MRALLLTITVLLCSAAPAVAGTRPGQVHLYAVAYGSDQGWVLSGVKRTGGDNRHAEFELTYLANPAPGAANCYAEVTSTDMPGCPKKWYTGGIELSMDVEARVAKCGPGWFVVSSPLDLNYCGYGLPRWTSR